MIVVAAILIQRTPLLEPTGDLGTTVQRQQRLEKLREPGIDRVCHKRGLEGLSTGLEGLDLT